MSSPSSPRSWPAGELEIPIARTFRLTEVQDAFRLLGERKTHGKIVLIP